MSHNSIKQNSFCFFAYIEARLHLFKSCKTLAQRIFLYFFKTLTQNLRNLVFQGSLPCVLDKNTDSDIFV